MTLLVVGLRFATNLRGAVMVTVRHGDVLATLFSDQLVPWLFGLNARPPGSITITVGCTSVVIEPRTESDPTVGKEAKERYSIAVNGTPMVLPASWVIPWASGLAASHGVDLPSLLDFGVRRSMGIQALMICHHRGWLTYNGIERN